MVFEMVPIFSLLIPEVVERSFCLFEKFALNPTEKLHKPRNSVSFLNFLFVKFSRYEMQTSSGPFFLDQRNISSMFLSKLLRDFVIID